MPLHLPLDGCPEYPQLPAPDLDVTLCTGDAGVDEFSGQYRRISVGEDEEAAVELGALALVYGHGVGGFVVGQTTG